jgi:hypothetical protein
VNKYNVFRVLFSPKSDLVDERMLRCLHSTGCNVFFFYKITKFGTIGVLA